MKEVLMRFLEFLTANDLRFRVTVFYLPAIVALLGFPLWWVLRGRSIPASLRFSAGLFLLAFFAGLIERNSRALAGLRKLIQACEQAIKNEQGLFFVAD
jgi:hypothetical protein